jgi:hypothetical protein
MQRDFAEFYVRLADAVHAADPHHPVIYREADDEYVGYTREALLRDGVSRPWFLYGFNAYTPDLADMLERWPSNGLPAPVVVTEFAPGGATRNGRPGRYVKMWRMIRRYPEYVLGGAPYVWSTVGDEAVDSIFGLVNGDRNPTDGSLDAIGQAFRAEE